MIVIAVVPSKTQWFVTNGNFVCDPVYCDDGFSSFSWRLHLTFYGAFRKRLRMAI